jgi:hypothetical protein
MRTITLPGDDFEAIYGVFVAHYIFEYRGPVFLNPLTIIRVRNAS